MSREKGSADGVVARGKIRVDARRAVEKLREHLLVDLHLYTLEIVRSAVAGGASRIDIEHDADDVRLTFDGASLSEGTLARLLDHVLVEAVSPEARRMRLLATGVNAALGLSPAYVDILTAEPKVEGKAAAGKARSCLRVRWTPELLTPDEKDGPAKAPSCDRVAAPKGMPESGVRIEVRRRIGWNVVKQAIAGGMLPEVALLASATHELKVPIHLAGKPFSRPSRAPALVRASFDVRGVRRAAIEIVQPLTEHPTVELLEHGVCLTRYAWSFGEWFPSEPLDKVALPVRVIVDADELPTNASRSEIRHDAPLMGLVMQAAQHAFADALQTLVAAVTGRGEAAHGTEILSDNKAALEDALGAIVCVVAKAEQRGAALSDKAKALLNAPLLRDGHGRPFTPASLRERAPSRLFIWRGSEPLSDDLAPWTGDVVWLRGRVAEKIFDLHDTSDAKEIIDRAKVGAARRRALLAHAAAEPTVSPLEDELLRQSFDVKEGDFDGLRGEAVIVAEGAERPGTVVRVFVDGRQLDTIDIDSIIIPLRLEIALGWEGRIRANSSYDGVERDRTLKLAIWYAARVAVVAANEAASRLGEKRPEASLRAALRAAIATLLLSTERLGLERLPDDVSFSSLRGLYGAPIWSTTEPDRWESLKGLVAILIRAGSICVAKPDAQGRAVDGRAVIALKERELSWLTAALPSNSTFVPYGRWLLSPGDIEELESRRASLLRSTLELEEFDAGSVMEFTRPGIRGLIAVGSPAKLVRLHAGRRVAPKPFTPSLGTTVVVVDDDTIIPDDAPTALPSALKGLLIEVERQLCETVVSVFEDAVSSGLLSPGARDGQLPISAILRAYLLSSARELRDRIAAQTAKKEDSALLERIRKVPFLIELSDMGEPVPVSLAGIDLARPAPTLIPYLSRLPGFETLAWRPILIARDDLAFAALDRWAGGRMQFGDPEIPVRMEQAAFALRRRTVLATAKLELNTVGDLAEATARVACVSWKTHPVPVGVTIAAALPNAYLVSPPELADISLVNGASLACAWIDVLYEGHRICRHVLDSLRVPVVARVNVTHESYLSGWVSLSDQGVNMAVEAVRTAAIVLSGELVRDVSGPSNPGALFGNLRALRLIAALVQGTGADIPWAPEASLSSQLRSGELLWPTVQGEWLPFDALRVTMGSAGPELSTGSVSHVPWLGPARGRADLDAPILYVPGTPEGAIVQLILQGLGMQCRSVTDAVGKLQSRRAAARPAEAPALAGAPVHPGLRVSLTEAGVQSAEGELELIEALASDVRIIGLDGASITVTDGLPFPVRVVARVESVDLRPEMTKALIKEISRAAVRRVLALSQKIDELPLFVRDHVRRVVCRAVANKTKMGARQMKAPVFLSIDGAWCSLEDISKDPGAPLLYTSDPPPYPKRRSADRILRLNKEEAGALGQLGKLRDMTPIMRRDRIAEERASAPPLNFISLDMEMRSKCVRVISVNEEGVTGEIGILGPQHQDKRGINVLVTKRPLCLIDDGPGWGLCALVNDDSIKPNRWFDGVKSAGSAQELQRVIRAAATRAMRAWLAPPADALAVRWLDGTDVVSGDKVLPIVGAIWLPAEWPIEPSVRLLRELGSEPMRQPVIAQGLALIAKRHVPVCGDLIAPPDVTWAELERAVLRETELMVEGLAEESPGGRAFAAYQWNLGLIGLPTTRVPPARTADGGEVQLADVLEEIVRKSCVWVSRRAGSVDGAFPGSPPAFVLLDESSPLLHVLRHRGQPGTIRELGGLPTSPLTVVIKPEVNRAPETTKPLYFREAIAADPSIVRVQSTVNGAKPAPVAPVLPWLERLRRRVALLFTTAPASPDLRLQEQNALCAALHQALGELGLVGGPVHDIIEAKRGPAIRYDERNKRILINRRHRALRWLRSSDAPSARALSFLIAAIVSEINRSLTEVTDAEERRVLQQLLRTGIEGTDAG